MNTRLTDIQPGSLDPSFGNEGVLKLPFPGFDGAQPQLVQALPNGKLLMFYSGESAQGFLTRLTESGKVDRSFGREGVVEIPFDKSQKFHPANIHLLKDGGWVVTGRLDDNYPFGPDHLAVVRQNKDGTLYSSFGDGGKVILKLENLVKRRAGEKARLLREDYSAQSDLHLPGGEFTINVFSAIQAQNGNKVKTVLTASVFFAPDDIQGIVLRLDEQGSLDKTFNGGGFLLVDVPKVAQRYSYARGVSVQTDNKIVVCGFFRRIEDVPSEAYVIRYQESGAIDRSFGSHANGAVTLGDPEYEYMYELTRLSLKVVGGAVIGVGSRSQLGSKSEGVLIYLNASGSFNRIFNGGKPLIIGQAPFNIVWSFCTFQPDGRIVVAGYTGNAVIDAARQQWVGRFLPSSEFDDSFGDGKGWAQFKFSGAPNLLRGATYMPDDRIVTCSLLLYQDSTDIEGFLVRFLG